jgi:hypothetical protein
MGLNQVAVVGPRSSGSEQKVEKKSDLEKIMEGLQLANTIAGLGANVQTIRNGQANIEAKEAEQRGLMTPAQMAELQKTHDLSDSPIASSVRMLKQNEDGTESPFFASVRTKNESPTLDRIEVPGADGKPVQKYVEKKAGAEFPVYQKPEAPKDDKTAGNTSDLRKEYNSQKTTQNTYQVVEAYNKVQAAAEAKSPSPTDDMSLIYGFMKMQDPGSTVREGEYASAENTRGISDAVMQAYNKAVDGQKLTPEQRANFLQSADSVYDAQLKAQSSVDQRYEAIAKKFGTDPQYVLEPQFQKSRTARTPASQKNLAPEDHAAIQWAQKNRMSKDPATAEKALKILELNNSGGR